jgi:hypothetical protein
LKAIEALCAATIGVIQFLKPTDLVFKMVYYYAHARVMKAAKAAPGCKTVIQAF